MRRVKSGDSSSVWFRSSFNGDSPLLVALEDEKAFERRSSSRYEGCKPKRTKLTRKNDIKNWDSDDGIEVVHVVSNSQPVKSSRKTNSGVLVTGEGSLLDRFAPTSADHLANNPKKVQEVRTWIQGRLEGSYRGHRTLLITGPSGSGKTATILVLASEFGLELVEFEPEHECEMVEEYGEQRIKESSEVDSFCDFFRNMEYSKHGVDKPKIVLIEQLPYKFYSDLRLFHETLSPFVWHSRQIIVIIQPTVESCWEMSPRRMFPKEFLIANDISEISFNKSAVSFLSKSLERIVKGLDISCPATEFKRIAVESEGDIRCAVNAIRFSIDSKGKWIKGVKTASGNRIDAFHMIGRLLYAKREQVRVKKYEEVESRLHDESLRRPAPERDVNEVLERGFMSSDQISSFIVEHEPKFAPSISALCSVLNTISMVDALPNRYDVRMRCNDEYMSQIAARSVMFSNFNQKALGGGMYKFMKSKWADLVGEMKELKAEVERNYKTPETNTSQLFTLTIPMLRTLKVPLSSLTFRSVGYLSRPMNVSYQLTRDIWVQMYRDGSKLTKAPKESHLVRAEVTEFDIDENSD